ncbi:MATE family efflux transporter [Brachyspira hyodysenteriae]|uniref:MATE family efflux transporter n=1 Tax=Brachyspira hyodysenteriae TaxID=159 RepID=UPI00063DBEB5|nr:MATE family efflux transporter [Brachyspira hyodysenteriae]KLI26471.1 multidrug transporter MATE [Brachyspira hyodysenteriae]TVL71911.1 MATE family efflux transporter [Brachyspira hyodysenteriae]TVL86726.1 MATE family efflux transporter [Brachyspira hyodysenteriae]
MTKDMTVGSPFKTIIYFSIPMLIGGIFQQFYGVADTIIIGKFAGSRALASIGATTSTMFFFLSFAVGFTNAFSIVMGQFFGAKNDNMLRRTFLNSIYVTLGSSLILLIFGLFFSKPLMILLKTPDDIIENSIIYLKICVGLSFGQLFYNGAASILRALGDSKTPLYFLILTTILNIILDLIFVVLLNMNVTGVAIATVISQVISAFLSILYIIKKFPILKLSKSDMVFDSNNLLMIIKIGVSMSVQAIFLSIGEMIISGVVNTFGTNVVASYTTGNRINQFASMAFFVISEAFAVYTAQNFGAGKIDRIKEGFKSIILLSLSLSILAAAIIFLFGDHLVRIFISSKDEYIDIISEICKGYLRISSVFYPFLGIIVLYNNSVRAIGKAFIPLISGITELVIKVGGSVFLSIPFGYIGVWFANPVGWAIGIIPTCIYFHKYAFKVKKTIV